MRRCAILVTLIWCVAGCRHTTAPDYGGEDGGKIAALVDRMNDDSNTVPKLKASFASGTPIGKKDIKTYPRFRYEIKGNPTVSGDSATATVEVCAYSGDDTGSEKEWTFVREGADWKIKSAPLP
jgi:hypothetical protein